MGIKNRLVIMSFLQFFVWGAWLITIANYWFGTKNWEGTQFGLVFGTMPWATMSSTSLSRHFTPDSPSPDSRSSPPT